MLPNEFISFSHYRLIKYFGRIDGHGGHGNYFTCFDHDLNVMNHEVLQH